VSTPSAYDLVTLGEVLLRLSIPSPARFETAHQLDVQIGGAEANVAAACARLGARTAWLSALPTNAWGDRVIQELRGHGVDCTYVRRTDDARMGTYFLEYGVPPRPIRVLYDRRESAFARLGANELDWRPVREARLVHVSGVTAALGDGGRALVRRAVAEAREVSFDVNYRATLWSPEAARAFIDEILPVVRYLFLGEAEARTVFGLDGAPQAMLEALGRLAPNAVVTLLRGADGCLTLDGGRVLVPQRRHTVAMVDPIGAGDAFVAGFLWATLAGRSREDAVEAGTAVAALKCSIWGDIARITPRDVDDVLAGGPDVRR
jgi:2-dehydro-3-deoxygluconokinase